MGWGTCGKNPTTGEMMGYCYEGECNDPNCKEVIHHGLSYVCGGMHEGGEWGCGKYFCETHLELLWFEDELDNYMTGGVEPQYDRRVCKDCYNDMIDALKENLIDEGIDLKVIDPFNELEHVK